MDNQLKQMVRDLIHVTEPIPGAIDLVAGDKILYRSSYFGGNFEDARQAMHAFYWGIDLLSRN